MTTPFALTLARPCPPGEPVAFTYAVGQQLNVMVDGSPAVLSPSIMMATGPTSSTAGSKTHQDDTD